MRHRAAVDLGGYMRCSMMQLCAIPEDSFVSFSWEAEQRQPKEQPSQCGIGAQTGDVGRPRLTSEARQRKVSRKREIANSLMKAQHDLMEIRKSHDSVRRGHHLARDLGFAMLCLMLSLYII